MPAYRTHHLEPRLIGKSLADAVKFFRGSLSREAVRALILGRQVQVNGNLCVDPQQRMKPGDVVRVWDHPLAKPPDLADIRIVHLDEHVVVVDKPAGLTTMRHADDADPSRRADKQPTLDELLPNLLAARLRAAPPPRDRDAAAHPLHRDARAKPPRNQPRPAPPQKFRPRLPTVRPVHRLDRDTSGLMLFALSAMAEQALGDAFRNRRITRSYRAVVLGHPDERTIESWFVRDRGDGLRGSTADDPPPHDAQRAVTHVRPIETVGDYAIVECRLETGRTHQIRIHLCEIGHPLCGEKLYRHCRGVPPRPDASGAPRHALHAGEIGFVHPATGRSLHFTSPFPPDLRDWLARLRQAARPASPAPPAS
jgi:23S rRNA pseudouridine1911/1915/1917 synthase